MSISDGCRVSGERKEGWVGEGRKEKARQQYLVVERRRRGKAREGEDKKSHPIHPRPILPVLISSSSSSSSSQQEAEAIPISETRHQAKHNIST